MKKIILLLLVFVSLFILIGCSQKEPTIYDSKEPIATIEPIETKTTTPIEIETEEPIKTETKEPTPFEKELIGIDFCEECFNRSFNIDEFNISIFEIILNYNDETSEIIHVTNEMVEIIGKSDFSEIGDYNIVINYNGFSVKHYFALYKLYTIYFYVDDEIINTIDVKSGEGLVDVPDVPVKEGFDGEWDVTDFTDINSDIIVNAIYKTSFNDIINSFKEYYRPILSGTISHNVELVTEYEGCSVEWESNNEEHFSNDGKYTRDYDKQEIIINATLTKDDKVRNVGFYFETEGYRDISKSIRSGYLYRNYDKLNDEFFDCYDIIYCAFVSFDTDGNFNSTSTINKIVQYVLPKAKELGIYVVISLNSASTFKTICSSESKIDRFGTNLVNLINKYGFDGMDFDWETPSTSDATLFTKITKSVYNKIKTNNSHHLVTAAITGGEWQPKHYDLKNSGQYLDYINVMTYGMCSSSGYYQNACFPHSSYDDKINKCGKTLGSCSISESIDIFNDLSIPNEKLIFGLAFYGIGQKLENGSWVNNGSILYDNLKKNYLSNLDYEYHYDEIAQVPYLVKKDGTFFVSYDDERSIIAKAKYMNETGCAGLMNWEIGCDTTFVLTKAMAKGLRDNN